MAAPNTTVTSPTTTGCKTILASTIATHLTSEILSTLSTLSHLSRPPHLLGLLSTPSSDPSALTYADWTSKTCHSNKITYTLRLIPRDEIENAITSANADPTIDGIIVYYPVFGNRQDQYLQNCVSLQKDVEGLSHGYVFNMYQNIRFLDPLTQTQKSILPCTPLAVIKILEYLHIYNTILPYGNRLFGRTICVVNRSEVVGRPLAALLANDGACVYSVDVGGVQKFTRGEGIRMRKHEVVDMERWGVEECVPLCDVVVTGVPGEGYKFPVGLLKEGAVCINFSSEKVCSFGWFIFCRLGDIYLRMGAADGDVFVSFLLPLPKPYSVSPSSSQYPFCCLHRVRSCPTNVCRTELPPRNQGKGFHLRPRHRQSHHRRPPSQSPPHRPE